MSKELLIVILPGGSLIAPLRKSIHSSIKKNKKKETMKIKIIIFKILALLAIVASVGLNAFAFGENGCILVPTNIKGDCKQTVEGIYKCQVTSLPDQMAPCTSSD